MLPCPVLIVGRNNVALSKKTVRSVLTQDVPVDLIFLDNNSSDGTASWIASKDFATITTGEQWSLAKCWNVGLKAFWKIGYERCLVLNNDLELRADACRMLSEHGGSFVTCVSVDDPNALGEIGDRTMDSLRAGERPHPDFSAFMIRKSVTDKIGWFNEDYFPAYVEDSLAHVKMHKAGIRAVCIDLPFLHHGASTLKQANPAEAAKIRRGADANRLRFKAAYGCLPGSKAYEELFAC